MTTLVRNRVENSKVKRVIKINKKCTPEKVDIIWHFQIDTLRTQKLDKIGLRGVDGSKNSKNVGHHLCTFTKYIVPLMQNPR